MITILLAILVGCAVIRLAGYLIDKPERAAPSWRRYALASLLIRSGSRPAYALAGCLARQERWTS